MKILIIRTFPSVLDPKGYNIQEIGFAKALVRCGVICDVVLYNGKNGNSEEIIDVKDHEHVVGNVKVYLRQGFGILKNGFFPGLKSIVKKYDVLQVHEYDQISSWKYYAFYKKNPVVIYHGPYYDEFNKGYNLKCKIFDNIFLKFKNNKDTLCFAKSNAAAEFLKAKGFKETVALGVGLDLDNFETNSSLPEISKDEFFNVIYVGKIEPRRNSFFLLDVMKDITEKNPLIHFTVIGDGEEEYTNKWLMEAQELINSNALTYFKRKTQTELKELYCRMDLMVFPSNYEIFGMVLLEAMYFDLPVISSLNGGSDTLITDGKDGIIMKGFDSLEWSDKILELANGKMFYETIKQNLKNKDHSLYTWDGIAGKYMSEIEKHFGEK